MLYKLRTIKDIFDKIPPSRIHDCMMELTALICSARNTAELIRLIAEDESGETMPNLYTFPDEIEWVDDGKGKIATNFPLADGSLTVEVKRKTGA